MERKGCGDCSIPEELSSHGARGEYDPDRQRKAVSMKRRIAIAVATIMANTVQLAHIKQGWCVYSEYLKDAEGKYRVSFIGICSGSLRTHNILIQRRYFGTSMLDQTPVAHLL